VKTGKSPQVRTPTGSTFRVAAPSRNFMEGFMPTTLVNTRVALETKGIVSPGTHMRNKSAVANIDISRHLEELKEGDEDVH
jgi:hypothetical protein